MSIPQLCSDFVSGTCRRGSRCRFLHIQPVDSSAPSYQMSIMNGCNSKNRNEMRNISNVQIKRSFTSSKLLLETTNENYITCIPVQPTPPLFSSPAVHNETQQKIQQYQPRADISHTQVPQLQNKLVNPQPIQHIILPSHCSQAMTAEPISQQFSQVLQYPQQQLRQEQIIQDPLIPELYGYPMQSTNHINASSMRPQVSYFPHSVIDTQQQPQQYHQYQCQPQFLTSPALSKGTDIIPTVGIASGEICRDFKYGLCKRGTNCRFAHSRQSQQKCAKFLNGTCLQGDHCAYAHARNKSETCRDFLSGKCKRGGLCRYIHNRGHITSQMVCTQRIPTNTLSVSDNSLENCRDFLNGKCFRNKCKFKHNVDSDLTIPSKPASILQRKQYSKIDNVKNESICMEKGKTMQDELMYSRTFDQIPPHAENILNTSSFILKHGINVDFQDTEYPKIKNQMKNENDKIVINPEKRYREGQYTLIQQMNVDNRPSKYLRTIEENIYSRTG